MEGFSGWTNECRKFPQHHLFILQSIQVIPSDFAWSDACFISTAAGSQEVIQIPHHIEAYSSRMKKNKLLDVRLKVSKPNQRPHLHMELTSILGNKMVRRTKYKCSFVKGQHGVTHWHRHPPLEIWSQRWMLQSKVKKSIHLTLTHLEIARMKSRETAHLYLGESSWSSCPTWERSCRVTRDEICKTESKRLYFYIVLWLYILSLNDNVYLTKCHNVWLKFKFRLFSLVKNLEDQFVPHRKIIIIRIIRIKLTLKNRHTQALTKSNI